jgi:hypothetical protein
MLGMNLIVLLLGSDDCTRIYVVIYAYVINWAGKTPMLPPIIRHNVGQSLETRPAHAPAADHSTLAYLSCFTRKGF